MTKSPHEALVWKVAIARQRGALARRAGKTIRDGIPQEYRDENRMAEADAFEDGWRDEAAGQ